jgi:tetratricopeptide (TPR) repeat protein
MFDRILGPTNQFSAATFSGLANMYFSQGDYSKAEFHYQRCLKLCEQTLGRDNPETARALNNLAFLYLELNDLTKAEPLFQTSLNILETASGPFHRVHLDTVLKIRAKRFLTGRKRA